MGEGQHSLWWEQSDQGTAFYLDDIYVGTAEAGGEGRDSFRFAVDADPGAVIWERRLDQPSRCASMRFIIAEKADFTMIPAVQYDRNRAMIKDYNQVRNESPLVEEKKEETVPTYFAGDRDAVTGKPHVIAYRCSSVPGATYSETADYTVGLFLDSSNIEGACSLYDEGDHTIHEVMWPERNSQPVYVGEEFCRDYEDRDAKERTIFRAVLVIAPPEYAKSGYRALLDTAWKLSGGVPEPEHTPEELWQLGIDYAKQLYTEEEDGFKGFSIGFTWKDGAWVKREHQKYEIGWCGQNASYAASLLVHAKKYGDREAYAMAVSVLDAWVATSAETGIIHTHYDSNIYTNGYGKTVDACNLAEAAAALWDAAEAASDLEAEKPEWIAAADRIALFAQKVMGGDGKIGKSWLEKDLTPCVTDGTAGAFLAWTLALYAARTGEEKDLHAAAKALAYYAQSFKEDGFTTAGALDIFTIDKESCIPLLKGALVMHDLTGEEQYLDLAVRAAYYLSTWQWHYDRPFRKGSLLEQMRFHYHGGTAVSIHGGMDPYALFYVPDLFRLWEKTGYALWKERAEAVWFHGQQYISDGTYVLDGKAPRPRGAQDEAVSTAFGKWMDSPSQWLVAWPAAFRLETLRKLPKGTL